MCYYVELKEGIESIARRFKAKFKPDANLAQGDFINAFSFPNLPVVLNSCPDLITTNCSWGLIDS